MTAKLYSTALREGWRFAVRHPMLWIFGLFAAFLGQLGLVDLVTKVAFSSSDYGLYPHWLALPKILRFLGPEDKLVLSTDQWLWLIWLGIVFVGFGALALFASVSSHGAIIHSVAQYVKKRRKAVDMDAAWHAGVGHFWRLFTLQAIKKFILLTLSIVVGLATLNAVNMPSTGDTVIFFLVFLLSVLVGMVVSFLVVYAAGYVVVEEYSLGEALHAAWQLFLDHWLVSIEVGLVILFLNLVLLVITGLALFLAFVPAIILWIVGIVTLSYAWYSVAVFAGVLGAAFVLMLVGSVFTLFVTSVWTELFMHMHKRGIKSHIMHLFSRG